jgi:hypothetical protein
MATVDLTACDQGNRPCRPEPLPRRFSLADRDEYGPIADSPCKTAERLVIDELLTDCGRRLGVFVPDGDLL